MHDVENAILAKLTKVPALLDVVLKKWAVIVKESCLAIVPSVSHEAVRDTSRAFQ
jgi:hypothetical protein